MAVTSSRTIHVELCQGQNDDVTVYCEGFIGCFCRLQFFCSTCAKGLASAVIMLHSLSKVLTSVAVALVIYFKAVTSLVSGFLVALFKLLQGEQL